MADAEIARLSSADNIGEAMHRSLPHIPVGARAIVESLLQPQTLAIVAGTLVVWAGSHFFGIGEIVDVILLTVGVLTLGFAVFEAAGALYDFTTGSINPVTEEDLETAARDFARVRPMHTVRSRFRAANRSVSSE